ncbi:energy-coupling factor ABC transporter permease [Candidatus Pyrohabitans sp.]
MHIAEGFLPSPWWYLWFIFTLPVLAYGLVRMRTLVEKNPEIKVLLALAGAFAFVLSALKIPSVTGSCSHPTGTGLAVVLFGPAITSLLASIVLLFQALLLAHGGLTTWGANVASMGIAGPVIGYAVWKLTSKLSTRVRVFLTAAVADLATYVVTSLQLALAFPAREGGVLKSFEIFMGIFAITQIPLAIIEGVLTVIVFRYILELKGDVLVKLGLIEKSTAGGVRP